MNTDKTKTLHLKWNLNMADKKKKENGTPNKAFTRCVCGADGTHLDKTHGTLGIY